MGLGLADSHQRVAAEEDIVAEADTEGGTVAEAEVEVVAGLGQAGSQQVCRSTSASSQSTEASARCLGSMFN